MRNGKQITTRQRWVRLIFYMLLGVGFWEIVTFLATGQKTSSTIFNLENLLMSSRILVLGLIGATVYSFYQANRHNNLYLSSDQEDDALVEKWYQTTFKQLKFGAIFFNLLACLVTFNIVVGLKLLLIKDGAELTIPILDYLFLIPLVIGQIVYAKLISRIRDYQISIFPTVSEMKGLIYSYDEAEQQAHFEQSFTIVFRLNNYILPALYLAITIISVISQTDQIVAFLVVMVIHIYINITQFQMVRTFFK
ncbi:DUF3169 family protein [Streptococcus pluranimalium]|uniref:DUF3169 family protein n=1 Tax=Streptococcus pluranimalium TaxID=82348 RepID=UPI0039FCB6DA